ncbi:MAG: hypothetical protein D6773_07810 [Alphaproteobacteria bacterium]|nr:MAG: hypothetical protein D6773_07810 [Alphaproteobacteria bacterium]
MFKAASSGLNGDRATTRVTIQATAPGSFLVQLAVDVGVMDQPLGLLDARPLCKGHLLHSLGCENLFQFQLHGQGRYQS